jgi:Tfp pilus assembly protein PilF
MMRPREARPRPRWRCLLVASAALVFAAGVRAEPRLPGRDDEVLERLPAGALARGPEETPLAFARRAFALGQRSWDPRLVGRAEAEIAPLLREEEPPLDALLLRAAILQHRHEFDAALAELDRVLARDRHAAAAWLLRASIQLVQGDLDESLASCAQLFGKVDALVATTCAGQAAGRAGRAQEAYTRMRRALDAASAPEPEVEVWARTELAELAWRLGEPRAAERELERALELEPESASARALLADLLLDAGRAAEARALFAETPRAEGLLLRLALAERALGDPEWLAHRDRLEASFAETRLRGGAPLYEREEAIFALSLADDPARARSLARANFARQREPADARILERAERAAGEEG